jgi:ubiquinone/menaquinone biosynthesis C-methylase UbiE
MIRRGYTVEGIEASEEAKRVVENKLDGEPELKKYAHLRVFNEEDTKLPYTDSSFDYVLCISVLSLLGSRSNVKNMLNEFHRVMKSNAKMIIDVNGPNSDFSNHATVIDEDVYEYRGLSGTEEPRVCYCPQNEEKFKTLLQELFKIDDMGHSSFQYVGNESFEYIACVRKKELAQATEKQGTLEDEEESTIQTPLDPLQ